MLTSLTSATVVRSSFRLGGSSNSFEVLLVGAAERIPARDWNRLAGRGFHCHEWFAAVEAVDGADWQPRHIAVYDRSCLRAIIPAYLKQPGLYGNLHDQWLGPARDLARRIGLRLDPMLCVTSPYAPVSAPLGEIETLPESVLERVFDLLEEQAQTEGAKGVVWPWLDTEHTRLLEVAGRRGYADVFRGAAAALEICWPSYEAYLRSRSKNVRRTMRKDQQALHDTGCRSVWTHDFAAHAGEMDALYRSTFRERNGRSTTIPANFFARLAETPPRGLCAHLTWQGEQLMGMSLNLSAGGVMDGGFVAFAGAHRAGPAYYNDLIYEPVRIACCEGIQRIELGPSALYPKVLRGASLRPQLTLVRGSTPAKRALLASLGRVVGMRNRQKQLRALAPLRGR